MPFWPYISGFLGYFFGSCLGIIHTDSIKRLQPLPRIGRGFISVKFRKIALTLFYAVIEFFVIFGLLLSRSVIKFFCNFFLLSKRSKKIILKL